MVLLARGSSDGEPRVFLRNWLVGQLHAFIAMLIGLAGIGGHYHQLAALTRPPSKRRGAADRAEYSEVAGVAAGVASTFPDAERPEVV
jgi:hypothetical protein